MHDKAFETGLFTLSDGFRVMVNPVVRKSPVPRVLELAEAQGQRIKLRRIVPLTTALAQHRKRVKFDAKKWRWKTSP